MCKIVTWFGHYFASNINMTIQDLDYEAGIILCMRPANERRHYNVTSSLIGWAHAQNEPYEVIKPWCNRSNVYCWYGYITLIEMINVSTLQSLSAESAQSGGLTNAFLLVDYLHMACIWGSHLIYVIPRTRSEHWATSPAPQSWLAYPHGSHPNVTWLAVGRSILI